jgi:twitching motility protein PilT
MGPAKGALALEPDDLERIVMSVLPPEVAERYREEKDADFSFSWGDRARFRGNVFVQRGAMAMALRLIPFRIPTFEELGLPPVAERFVQQPRGLVLATGATGAGKSTTLASMIDRINQDRPCHIITVEDPIEYVHHHARAAVNQREVGQDTGSFARALRSALRADPDVLLVGEMRDLETIQTVLTMAETGHLVFGTLHTNDAAQAIDRIVDVFPSERQAQIRVQLANTLTGIICQHLLPRIGGGRVAAFEVLVATHAVRNLIKEGKSNQLRNVMLTGQADGMSTLEASLSDLVTAGAVTYEEALARSLYPKEVAKPRPVAPVPGASAVIGT